MMQASAAKHFSKNVIFLMFQILLSLGLLQIRLSVTDGFSHRLIYQSDMKSDVCSLRYSNRRYRNGYSFYIELITSETSKVSVLPAVCGMLEETFLSTLTLFHRSLCSYRESSLSCFALSCMASSTASKIICLTSALEIRSVSFFNLLLSIFYCVITL